MCFCFHFCVRVGFLCMYFFVYCLFGWLNFSFSFLKGERRRSMELGGGEELEGVGGGERVIRIYCLRYFFSVNKRVDTKQNQNC